MLIKAASCLDILLNKASFLELGSAFLSTLFLSSIAFSFLILISEGSSSAKSLSSRSYLDDRLLFFFFALLDSPCEEFCEELLATPLGLIDDWFDECFNEVPISITLVWISI